MNNRFAGLVPTMGCVPRKSHGWRMCLPWMERFWRVCFGVILALALQIAATAWGANESTFEDILEASAPAALASSPPVSPGVPVANPPGIPQNIVPSAPPTSFPQQMLAGPESGQQEMMPRPFSSTGALPPPGTWVVYGPEGIITTPPVELPRPAALPMFIQDPTNMSAGQLTSPQNSGNAFPMQGIGPVNPQPMSISQQWNNPQPAGNPQSMMPAGDSSMSYGNQPPPGMSMIPGQESCWGPCKQAAAQGTHAAPAEGSEAAITTTTLSALIQSKVRMALIDTRTGESDDGKRLPGAQLLSSESSPDDIQKIIPEKNFLVVTYGAQASANSVTDMAKKLRDLGYLNVIEYREGIQSWEQAGQAIEEKK